MTKPLSVLCVDDNASVAPALERWFRRLSDFEWLGSLRSADELQATVDRLNPDVVLLDLDMPGADPVVALKQVRAEHKSVRIVMLSAHLRPEDIDRCLTAGAAGYLSKNATPADIAAAVKTIASGKRVLSPEAEESLRLLGPLGK